MPLFFFVTQNKPTLHTHATRRGDTSTGEQRNPQKKLHIAKALEIVTGSESHPPGDKALPTPQKEMSKDNAGYRRLALPICWNSSNSLAHNLLHKNCT